MLVICIFSAYTYMCIICYAAVVYTHMHTIYFNTLTHTSILYVCVYSYLVKRGRTVTTVEEGKETPAFWATLGWCMCLYYSVDDILHYRIHIPYILYHTMYTYMCTLTLYIHVHSYLTYTIYILILYSLYIFQAARPPTPPSPPTSPCPATRAYSSAAT